MTKQEQIFEAIGGIDDDIAANALKSAERSGRKIPLKLVLIAALLAAVSLLAGFTVIFKNTVEQNGKALIELKIKVCDVVHPSFEELTEMGAYNPYEDAPGVGEEVGGGYVFTINADPRTVIEKYGLHFIISDNDNFIRVNPEDYPESNSEGIFYRTQVAFSWDDFYEDKGLRMNEMVGSFMYGLIDKRLDLPVGFMTKCYTEELNVPMTQRVGEWTKNEIIDMNNGEKALLGENVYDDRSNTRAYFTYDGIFYQLSAETDINGMKEVLADLGVL